MTANPFSKILSLYLSLTLLMLSLPAQGLAMFLPADRPDIRSQDLACIRTTLESSLIQQRLKDYGLSADEAAARLSLLSEEQLHQYAAQLDSLQAGGGVIGDVIFLLLVVLIVLVVLEASGQHVVLKKR